MRGVTGITIQLHQTLRLPRKRNLMIDPHHIWNVIYNARSKQSQPRASPNTAPATQNESHDWSASHMKLFTMRGASKVNLEPHQRLRLPRKMNLMIDPRHIWNVIYNARSKHSQPPTSPNTALATKSVSSRFQRKHRELLPPIERRFEQIPTMIRAWNRHLAPAASETLLVPSWRRILYWNIQHFALRLSPKMSPNAAPATKSHTPTSPNTAPATQNASHDWSASHMKRHLQCAEKAKSTSNLTKYTAPATKNESHD